MKLSHLKLAVAATTISVGMATAAAATIVTVFDGIAQGRADFDATVTAAGGTPQNTVLGTGTSVAGGGLDFGDFVVTRNNGGTLSTRTYGTMSGRVFDIDPAVNSGAGPQPIGGRLNPLDYFDSGITFTFDQAVNSVGFEVGDWATCCHNPVTELYISFDGGAPILVASATQASDGIFPRQTGTGTAYEIFVAAFDDTGDFTEVSFWGNGTGEILVAGGDVRYERISQGSLPPTGQVPLPAAAWMLLAGLGGLGVMRARKKA